MTTSVNVPVELASLGAAWVQLDAWDLAWAGAFRQLSAYPSTSGALPKKLNELISVALNAAATDLNEEGTRRRLQGALDAGAKRDEPACGLKCASVLSIHSAALAAPMLFDEAKVDRAAIPEASIDTPPACEGLEKAGQWNVAWDPNHALDSAWTDERMRVGLGIYAASVLSAKDIELLSIALDASVTDHYAPSVRRHIYHALKAGASPQEIMEVLKLTVSLVAQTCNLGEPILAEELARRSTP